MAVSAEKQGTERPMEINNYLSGTPKHARCLTKHGIHLVSAPKKSQSEMTSEVERRGSGYGN